MTECEKCSESEILQRGQDLYDKGAYFWTSKTANLGYCTQIGVDKYLWTTMGNKSKLACLRFLFEKCDIAETELVMLLEPVKE